MFQRDWTRLRLWSGLEMETWCSMLSLLESCSTVKANACAYTWRMASPPACAESSSPRCCDCSWLVIGLLETLGPRSVIAAFSMERGLARNEAELALGVHAGVLQVLPTSRSTSKYPGAPNIVKACSDAEASEELCCVTVFLHFWST